MKKQKDPFEGCVLHEMAKRGEYPEYKDPSMGGLPKLTVKSAPAWSAALAGAGLDGRLRMSREDWEAGEKRRIENNPFAGCVLHEMAKRGEHPEYKDPSMGGLPKLTVKSAPAWSAALAGAGLDGRLRMPDKKHKK